MEDSLEDAWRQCADWLIRCGSLDPTHRSVLQRATLYDFAQILRDGVILCDVINRLRKNSVDNKDVVFRPQLSQFMCMKNISLFLVACQKHFGFDPNHLFNADDLFKCRDFGKILGVLSKLSRSAQAKKCEIEGFVFVEPEESISNHDYYNEIYRNLEEEAEGHDLEESEYNSLVMLEDPEQIYDQIVRNPESRLSRQEEEDFQPTNPRDHCIKELVDTERNYINALKMMSDKFVGPFKDILTPEDHARIFINLTELVQIHTAFSSDLAKAARFSANMSTPNTPFGNSARVQYVGDVFLKWKSKFTIYGTYCAKLTTAQKTVDRLRQEDPDISARIVEAERSAERGSFRLQDYLPVPMQRVLKYPLILQKLLKETPVVHEERTSLQLALEAMNDLSFFVNEVKRDYETFSSIEVIQNSISDLSMPENTTLADYGRLLRDGEIRIANHAEDKKIKLRYIFVFDKVLMICKALKTNIYTFKNALVLSDFNVEDSDILNNAGKGFLKSSSKWGFMFSLVQKSGQNVYILYTKSAEMKEKWKQAIHMAHDNVRPAATTNTDHIFQIHTFDSPTECSRCSKLLCGLKFQGYKCGNEACDAHVHKQCIAGYLGCGQTPARPISFPLRARTMQYHDTSG